MAASPCRCLAASRPTAYSGIAPGGRRMPPTTRPCRSLWISRRVRHRLAAACLTAAAIGWTPVAAPAAPPKVPEPPAEVVRVEGGRLTVDVRDAELADVLLQVGDAAGFHLTITGE